MEATKKESLSKRLNEIQKKNDAFYDSSSAFGYFNKQKNARFLILLGGRQAGKSYNIMKTFIKDFLKHDTPFYWLRLNEASSRKLLENNAEKLVDPDLRRKYKLDLVTKGTRVYRVKRDKDGNIIKSKTKLFCTVLALSTFYSDKGVGLYDKDFLNDPTKRYNICLDEFMKECGEKSQGDIAYQLVNQLENLVRNTKERLRIILIANCLEEASDILSGLFNFIPEEFGRYWLENKKCLIEYIKPTEKYKQMRKDSCADILMPDASNFTNEIKIDTTLITKCRTTHPNIIIKFTKNEKDWFVIWDSNIIKPYNNEKCKAIVSMRPYIDESFLNEKRDSVITLFDTRSFLYGNLITFKKFQHQIQLLKPRSR